MAPNKKKKQLPKNAFYFYMMDCGEDLRKDGRNYSNKELAEIAAPSWPTLSDEDRRYYEDMAKADKLKHGSEGKMDTYGNLIQNNLKHETEVQEQVTEMYRDIEKYVCHDLGGIDAIKQEFFYFMSSKYFCKTDEGYYVPAEIALVKYSIADGIIDHYHSFIDPGSIPMGYASACKDTSENQLYIPYSKFEKASSDYAEIVSRIMSLLSSAACRRRGRRIIIFCFPEEIEHTENILENLMGGRNPDSIQLYDVSMLLSWLMRYTTAVMSERLARDFLSTDIYTHTEQTCCDHHWEEDHPVNCALGWAKRICYVFSNHLCDPYYVDVIPGKHLPARSSSNHVVVAAPISNHVRNNFATGRNASSFDSSSRGACAAVASPSSSISSGIIKRTRSKYDTTEDVYVEKSLAPELERSVRLAENKSPKVLAPLRQPTKQSFAQALHPRINSRDNFTIEDDETFPSLDVNSRPSSVMTGYTSDVSLGMSGGSSISSYSMQNVSSVSSSMLDSATPVGRGMGRGIVLSSPYKDGWGRGQ